MEFYLLKNPPKRPQFLTKRRATPTGCQVIHTAENVTDLHPPDTGAEAVAAFIANRTDAAGSYHRISDFDSVVAMMPFSYEAAQDGTGSNRWAIGIAVACQAHQWPTLPEWWVEGAVAHLALAATEGCIWLRNNHGIVTPPRRITRAESEAGQAGFITHAERDPGRRSDPGPHFPWARFFEVYTYFCALNGITFESSPKPAPAPAPAPAPVPAPISAARVDLPTLRRGAEGGAVRSLQALLVTKASQDLGKAGVDGSFGSATDTAVRNVQRYFSISVDGVVGKDTWGALFL